MARALQNERKQLPIFASREDIISQVSAHDNLVVVGETGSGKTTQIPQYIYESGLHRGGTIAVTQPRRVAAITVAQRVAQEMGCKLGDTVGYTIRFDDTSSAATRIKFLTDGMLLRESVLDPLLSNYSVVLLDEAHERSLHTDMLFAILKGIQRKRLLLDVRNKESKSDSNSSDGKKSNEKKNNNKAKQNNKCGLLKVICMSATLEAEKFSKFFGDAKILSIPGRLHPVQVMYASEPQSDYLDAVVISTLQIHLYEPPGDVLVFLTGQDEIEMAMKLLEAKNKLLLSSPPPPSSSSLTTTNTSTSMLLLPLYAALPSEKQLRVFAPCPPHHRKIILSTNLAETSITLPGILYVIDTGVVKVRQYFAKTGLDSLVVVPISKAEAWQRSGRAGRIAPGVCYRLYTEDVFETLDASIVPEIVRCNLAGVVLQLKALKIDDVLGFDFMDKPPQQALVRALENLYALGALDDNGGLSKLGAQMSALPLDPLFSKVLLASCESDFGCSQEMLWLVSVLSLESSLFVLPTQNKDQAAQCRARFASAMGDHMTYLEVCKGFSQTHGVSPKQWCVDNFVHYRSMVKVGQIRKQLKQLLDSLHLDSNLSCGTKTEAVRRCLVSGFFLNVAKRQPDGGYKTIFDGQTVHIHPSSVLLGQKPECVLYNQMVFTTKQYVRDLSIIEPAWLSEVVPAFFPTASSEASRKVRISAQATRKLSSRSESNLPLTSPVALPTVATKLQQTITSTKALQQKRKR